MSMDFRWQFGVVAALFLGMGLVFWMIGAG